MPTPRFPAAVLQRKVLKAHTAAAGSFSLTPDMLSAEHFRHCCQEWVVLDFTVIYCLYAFHISVFHFDFSPFLCRTSVIA